MDFSLLEYCLLVLAGTAAGVVNTFAGSGSVFTLSVLLFVGLPADVANGTNRIGTTVQSLIGTTAYYRSGKLETRRGLKYLLPVLVGAVFGAFTAADLNEEALRYAIGGIMILLLLLTVFNPQRYLERKQLLKGNSGELLIIFVFLGIGFYGGFIQAGIGIFLMVALSVASPFRLVEANGLKLLTVFLFSFPVLAIFLYFGQINWLVGLWVALGQAIGSYFASKFVVKNKSANKWLKGLLIIMMVVTIFKMFGAF